MERTPVQSSTVLSIGYDPATQVLEVELPGGRVYQATDVSQEHADGFVAAESKGRYFAQLKRAYTFTRVVVDANPAPAVA